MNKTIWKEIYDVPTPLAFTIGDSLSLEKILQGDTTAQERKRVYRREKIPKTWKAKVVFRRETLGKAFEDPVYSVNLYVCHKDYIDTYVSGSYYPSAVRKGGDRMLETQRDHYKVATTFRDADENGKTEYCVEFDNGIDGYFASLTDCVVPFGFLLYFDLPPATTMSVKKMRESLAYLFRCPAIVEGRGR